MRSDTHSYDHIRVFVGCGAKKQTTAVKAKELYTSAYFNKKRTFAELYGDDWYIISAKHGVIEPDTVIEPYDKSVTNMAAAEQQSWGADTSDELQNLNWDSVDIAVMLMGQSYLEPLESTLETLPVTVAYPFENTS